MTFWEIIEKFGVPIACMVILGFTVKFLFNKLVDAYKSVGEQKDNLLQKSEDYQKEYQQAMKDNSDTQKQLADSINLLTSALLNIRNQNQGGSDAQS